MLSQIVTVAVASREEAGRLVIKLLRDGYTEVSVKTAGNGAAHEPTTRGRAEPHGGQSAHRSLIYTTTLGGGRVVDITVNLKRYGLTEKEIMAKHFRVGTPRHRLKMAIIARDREAAKNA